MVNAWADHATKLRPFINGSRAFRRFFHFALPEPYRHQYQLGPKGLRQYLSERAGADLAKYNQAEFGTVWKPARGLLVEWFTPKQQKHIQQQCMACVATMQELSRRWAVRGVYWPEHCPFCKLQGNHVPDMRIHAWQCQGTRAYAMGLLEEMEDWLLCNWYKARTGNQEIRMEVWSAIHVVVWTMATATDASKKEKNARCDWGALH